MGGFDTYISDPLDPRAISPSSHFSNVPRSELVKVVSAGSAFRRSSS